jgi:hypothetical protein
MVAVQIDTIGAHMRSIGKRLAVEVTERLLDLQLQRLRILVRL